jgi:hypothetical protein
VRPLILLAVGIVTVAQVAVLRWATGRTMPFAAVVIVILNTVGATGYLYFRDVAQAGPVSAALAVGASEYDAAGRAFALASLAVLAGGLVGSIGRHWANVSSMRAEDLITAVARLPGTPLLLGCAVPLLFTTFGTGVVEVVSRPQYLYTGGPSWMAGVGDALTPIGMTGAALILFENRRRTHRGWACMLLVAYVALLLSRDTRLLAVMPLALFASFVLQGQGRKRGRVALLAAGTAAAASALFLLQLTLALREQVVGAGLAPYLAALARDPGLAFTSTGGGVAGAFQNVLFSVPLTGYLAADLSSLPASALSTSLSPLPSGFTDWENIAPLLRLNIYTPYSALGELAVHGALVLSLYFAVVGYLASRLQILSARLPGFRPLVLQLVLGTLFLFFSFTALEYNLRSSTRLIWYAVLIYVLVRILPSPSRRDIRASSALAPRAAASGSGFGSPASELHRRPSGGLRTAGLVLDPRPPPVG